MIGGGLEGVSRYLGKKETIKDCGDVVVDDDMTGVGW